MKADGFKLLYSVLCVVVVCVCMASGETARRGGVRREEGEYILCDTMKYHIIKIQERRFGKQNKISELVWIYISFFF